MASTNSLGGAGRYYAQLGHQTVSNLRDRSTPVLCTPVLCDYQGLAQQLSDQTGGILGMATYIPSQTTYATSTSKIQYVWDNWYLPDDGAWGKWTIGTDTATGGSVTVSAQVSSNGAVHYEYWPEWQGEILTRRETREQEQARLAEQQRQAAVANQRRAEYEAKIHQADARADKLLRQFLNEQQIAQYEKEKAFTVELHRKDGSTARYRIQHGWAGNVKRLDDKGRHVESLCIHATQSVPIPDNLLTQKLLLESSEEEFRRIANVTRLVA